MAGAKEVRTLCVYGRPVRLEDGTLCRCESPLPGPVGTVPSWRDNFASPLGVGDASQPLGEEAWFEQRYPNLLEDARLKFVEVINSWVQSHWGDTRFQDQKQRIPVIGRNLYENPKNAQEIQAKKMVPDNRFERCGRVVADGFDMFGDTPQTRLEADQVVGSFWLDIETPVTITYSTKNRGGRTVRSFEWTAVMYVGDVLGLQTHDPHASLHWAAPSRKVKRARWKIHGENVSDVDRAYQPPPVKMHRVAPGDILPKLAEKYYGDARLWPILYAVNREIIGSDPNKLRIGDPLRILDLDELSPSEKDRAMNSVPKGSANTISMPPLR
jgi:hypothetical protein